MIAIIAPSLDDKRIYPIRSLKPGGVLRSRAVIRHASGKGANAARAAARLGAAVLLVAPAGEEFRGLLDEQLGYLGVRLLLTGTRLPTRSCITVLEEDGRATELVQEALPMEKDEVLCFEGDALGAIDGADAVLLAGSLPGGMQPSFLARCAARAAQRGIPIVCDLQGEALLAAAADVPAVIKINRKEFDALRSLLDEAGDDDALGAALIARGASCVIVTDGPRAVRAWTRDGVTVHDVPPGDVVNPVGSGDAMSGALTVALADGVPLDAAIRAGIAAGAANVRTLLPGEV
jgi:1-phosphofructokinase family hexose kinase